MKKIIIATVYKGFNYGSSLQAYASKMFLSSFGYEAEVVWYRDGMIKGRDIRLKKLFIMLLRTLLRPCLLKETFLTYRNSMQRKVSSKTKHAFLDFANKKLQVRKYTWKGLKRYAYSDAVVACICGSDQIWNATHIYIDPIFYLRFAPQEKRLAYAPSFGKDEIPKYNKAIIKKYLSEIEYLSVRENAGASIIKELLGVSASVLIDPTLLLDKKDWLSAIDSLPKYGSEKYILLYFLDRPSSVALQYIKRLVEIYNCSAITIPYSYDEFHDINACRSVSAGPLDFVALISNALFVCTDSFHGTAFSINFNIPFLTFKRDYGIARDQSSRVVSLLDKLGLSERFIYETLPGTLDFEMSFKNSNDLLGIERQVAKEYLLNSLANIEHRFSHEVKGE